MISWMPLLGENSLFKLIGNIFHPLFIAVADTLAFIYGIVPNYALAIVILTIIIMGLLTPLTIKSTRSMVAMQGLQPEMQKLRQKYKGAENREQLNREMMALYKEHGVSPTGGCLPMFLQMPALIVLYDVIRGIANTVNKGSLYPQGTIYRNHAGHLVTAGVHTVCNFANGMVNNVCAVPRYIPTSSRMYHDVIASPGVLKAFGINLASKPLSHHTYWYDYIPYFVFVAVAVGLQYIQMSQMTKRNKAAAQMNSQMQTIQKIMPLIFAYIYFLVPVGVVLYMIASSAIRILTQDLIFRHGVVQAPGQRQIGGIAKKPSTPAVGGRGARPELPKADSDKQDGKSENGKEPGGSGGRARAPRPTAGGTSGRPSGGKPSGSQGKPPAQRRPGSNGRSGNGGRSAAGRGNGADAASSAPKPHPRSKSKRERKAR